MIKNNNNRLEDNLTYNILRLSLACNADCLFCNVPPESYRAKEMTLKEAKIQILKLISSNKHAKLDISGGEPTIRKDLFELIKYATQRNIETIELQTNGILLHNKDFVKRLKAAGLHKVFVGLHSHIPEIHDDLVGFKGAFRKCIEGVKNSIELDIVVVPNPVITTKNYKCLPDYIKFLGENFPQIRSMSLSVVQPRGRAWKNRYLVPRYELIDPYISKALRISRRYNLIVHNPYCGLPLCIGGWYQYLDRCVEYYENLIKIKQGVSDKNTNIDKVKAIQCFWCDLNNFCKGVWKEYALLYPLVDLKPIRSKKNIIKVRRKSAVGYLNAIIRNSEIAD